MKYKYKIDEFLIENKLLFQRPHAFRDSKLNFLIFPTSITSAVGGVGFE